MKFQNRKIWIGDNPDLCKKVQEKLFELGCKWYNGKIVDLKAVVLFLDDTGTLTLHSSRDKDYYVGHPNHELTLEELGIEEEKTEFVVGKWYKYRDWYIKYQETNNNGIFISSEKIDNDKRYYKAFGKFGDDDSNKILLTDLSEIQEYLPLGHPDLILKEEEDLTGRYIKALVDKPDGGSVLEGEVGLITSEEDYIYVDFSSQNCYAIRKENIGYRYELLPKDYSPEDSSIPEYVECITDEFILIDLGKIYETQPNSTDTSYLLKKTGGNCYSPEHFKPSTKEAYEQQNSKSDMKAIQKECKRRFPIGCKYKVVGFKYESILINDHVSYSIHGDEIYTHNGGGCLYLSGEYAELVSLPKITESYNPSLSEEKETKKPLIEKVRTINVKLRTKTNINTLKLN